MTAPDRLKRCRYRRLNDEPCCNPALDQADDAVIFVCVRHASRVLALVAEHRATKRAAP
jgi:hypothetical protein